MRSACTIGAPSIFVNKNELGQFPERPSLTGHKISVANPTPNHWFNTAAFKPSILVYGDSPRNPVVGPGKHTFDLSLGKNFKMPYSENHSLQFRAEFFNAFNTPQFANPDRYVGEW